MRGRQKLQPLGLGRARDQRDLAPPQAVVGDGDRARRPQARHLEPAHPVADLGGKRQFNRRRALTRRETRGHAGQLALDPRRVGTQARNLDLLRRAGLGPQRGQAHDLAIELGRAQADGPPRALEHADGALCLERGQQVCPPEVIQTIGQPERLETAPQRGSPGRDSLRIGHPGARGQRRQPRGPGVGGQELGCLAPHHGDRNRAPVAGGFFQRGLNPRDSGRPVAGIGPGAIQHDQ